MIDEQVTQGSDLYHRTVRGGFWVFVLRATEKILNLIRLIILARLLVPDDFGLLGIALLIVASLETFSQTGLKEALIQKKEHIESYLNSAWTLLLIRGVILSVAVYFSAPYLATLFKSPEIALITRVIGLSLIVRALTNIGVVYFLRDIDFKKQLAYKASGTIADFVVAVSAALILRNVWALVFGVLAGDIARSIASYIVHSYRPRFDLDFKKMRELLGFGKWVLGSSTIGFLVTQGDDVFVGKVLGAMTLGFYQLAYKISNMPTTEIVHMASRITFPAYSKLQDNTDRLSRAYLRVLRLTAFLSFPFGGLIFLLANDFTILFLGDKWLPIAPVMQVLVFWGLIRSIGASTGPVFYAIGKPAIVTKLQFLQLALLVILIYPLTMRLELIGTSLSVVFAALIPNIMVCIKLLQTLKCKTSEFLKFICIPLINTAGAILSIVVLRNYIMTGVSFGLFAVYISVFIATYLILVLITERLFNYGILPTLRTLKGTSKS